MEVAKHFQYFSSLCCSNYWKFTILIIKKHDILNITKTSKRGGIKTKLIGHRLSERGFSRGKQIPGNTRINLKNKETRWPALILDLRGKHVWKIERTRRARPRLQIEGFVCLQLGAVSLSFFCSERACGFLSLLCTVSACTLISRVRRGNSELRKGQTVTFVCDSGLKWDMMRAAQSGLHAYARSPARARLGCHCGIDPCFLTPHYSEKSKLKSSLFCSSGALRGSFPPTPLPLTLARGHPPVDGTIPAAFDTEFALQPTAISWFCNKSKWKRCLSLSLLHCCDLIWLQGAKQAKKAFRRHQGSYKK